MKILVKATKLITVLFCICSLQLLIAAQKHSDVEKEITEMMNVYRVPGLSVAIVKDRKIILCRGFGLSNIEKNIPFDQNTVGRLASATKFLTGLAVLRMAEKGVINLNDPLKKYVSDIPKDWQEIPLWRLMNHTSGIPSTDNTPFMKMTDDEQRTLSERTLFQMISKMPLDYQSGSKWRYQQTAFVIMAMIIMEKTGKTWQEVIRDTILQPAGMENTVHNELIKYPADLMPKNYEFENGKFANQSYFYVLAQSTGAGYNSTATDLARMFLALNENKIVSLKFLENEDFAKERMYPLNEAATYSIATENRTFGKFLTIGHSGGPDLANIRYSPDKKLGVAVLANRSTAGIAEDLTNRIFRRMILGIPFDKQQQPLTYAIRKMISKSSYEQLAAFYDQAQLNQQADSFKKSEIENDFNLLGYALIHENRFEDAIKILRLNVREFPQSANAYDSLGEAYLDTKYGTKVR